MTAPIEVPERVLDALFSEHVPIEGPKPDTPEWLAERTTGIFASEAAAACGLSPFRQPLDVYLAKLGLAEPFDGNEYTRRGKRFEPFIGAEYSERTGAKILTGLPTYRHPVTTIIGATPDGVLASDLRHGVEFKACGWRRAAQLGEEQTDQIFEDWLCQVQQQMYVMGWVRCDVFVMVDLHTYRLYTAARNDSLIDRIVQIEMDLWDRIQRREPPAPDFTHPAVLNLIRALYRTVDEGETVILPSDIVEHWRQAQALSGEIHEAEAKRDELRARVEFAMGAAAVGRLPDGRELVRHAVAGSLWTAQDVIEIGDKIGQVKRKGYVKLTERKARETV